MQAGSPRLAMVAGEASGDLLAALLLGGLKARWPTVAAAGIGGPRLAALGFDAWWPASELAVRGYVEVLRHYRRIAGIRRRLAEHLLEARPDAFIGVDAPDFNLGLEAQLKAAGVPTLHFVSPSIWAWRGSRIDSIAKSVDHMLCLFPFEAALYARAGIAATYVGHPLADLFPIEPPRLRSRVALGLAADADVVALLPGSRRSEIECHASVFLEAARLMHRSRPALSFILPAAPGLHSMLEPLLPRGVPIRLLDGRSHEALAACDVTLIASGTATLEAALAKRPMVIAYRMNPISYQILKRMRYQPWIGLPNILLEDFAVPELIQSAATPGALARETLAWLDDPARVQRLQQRFIELHHSLRRDTARLATDAIAATLAR